MSDAAHRFGLAEDWIWAVMSAESAGHPRAVSPVGAMGLMQIMPSTWKDLSARFALGADPFDARANIMAGAAYLRLMLDRYGDIVDTLAAYNAGPRRVDDWRAGLRILPPETIAYVTRIAAALQTSGGSEAAARQVDWRGGALFVRAQALNNAEYGTSDGPGQQHLDPPGSGGIRARQAEGEHMLFVPRTARSGQ